MSIPEEKQPFVGDCTVSPTHAATLMAQEGGDGCMGSRSMTVGRYEEIRRRLGEGRKVREIAMGARVFSPYGAGGARRPSRFARCAQGARRSAVDAAA
jgi:hypothetical protein